MKTLPPKNSLKPLPRDPRDFNLGAVFPQIDIKDVPITDFMVSQPISIKDQGESDLCSAYAVTSVSEDQEGKELLPQFQFLKTKQISGDVEEWGANLRDACKSAVKFGSLPIDGFENIRGLSRSQIFNPIMWPVGVDQVAEIHKKETYFAVTGKYDVFDNIRVALWQHKDKKCSIVTGTLFRSEWLEALGGVIPSDYGDNGFGHAFKIFGQKNIGGELYLVAQLSQGMGVGDRGLFYFSRKVTNKEIGSYGVFMFKDMSREDAEFYMNSKNKPLPKKFWEFIISLFK